MGCTNNRFKNIEELKKISNNLLDERSIENIIMKTYFNEKELLNLFKRFQELGPDNNGKISNKQLLDMNELYYCSFKKYLPKALKLKEDKSTLDEIDNIKINKRLEGNTINNVDEAPIEKYEDKNKFNKLESILTINAIDSNSKISPDNFNRNTNFNKLILNDKNVKNLSDENLQLNQSEKENLTETNYIDFQKFCDILKVFNPVYPVDMKIKYGDGKVSKKDLKAFLIEFFPDQGKYQSDEEEEARVDIDKLIEIVFSEIVYNERRTYIDYDEFSHVMWTTNIDKSCVIDLS